METLTIAARNDLVARISDLRERIAELEWGRSEDDAVLGLRTELSQAYESYAAGLPRLALSRCPFTGAVLTTAIDTWGLDGPWWDAERPVRPMEDTPSCLLVLSGAMRLVDPIEPADFLTLPGPPVPSVAPSLLERPGVSAVLGSLPVGRHTAYSIAYFADPPDDEPPPLNTLGHTELATSMERSGRPDRGHRRGARARCRPGAVDRAR